MTITPFFCRVCHKPLGLFDGTICSECEKSKNVPISVIDDIKEEVDDWRDRLDELEREEYYESKYGKEKQNDKRPNAQHIKICARTTSRRTRFRL